VFIWPLQGVVKEMNGAEVVVTTSNEACIPGGGRAFWESDTVLPLWRVILDNDPRLERNN